MTALYARQRDVGRIDKKREKEWMEKGNVKTEIRIKMQNRLEENFFKKCLFSGMKMRVENRLGSNEFHDVVKFVILDSEHDEPVC